MKLVIRSVAIVLAVFIAAIYINGCSTAEQTTGKLAFQQGDYKTAEREFEKETKQNATNEEAWYYLGASRLMLRNYDGANDAFNQYRKIGKNSFASEILDAWVKRFNTAADKFEAGQKKTNNDDKLKDYQTAIDEFKVCKVILPDSVVVDQYIKSIDSKIAVILINPIIDAGVAFDKEGKYEEAVNEYKKALAKVEKGSPSYEVVSYDIAVSLLKWGEKMRNENSENPAFKDKYKDALPYLEYLKESKDKPTKIQAYDLLVQVYANLGMNDEALKAMKIRDELKEQK
jgi:tetratricopeptide (TPR) repeat protein